MNKLISYTLLFLVFASSVAAADQSSLVESIRKQQFAFADAKALKNKAVAFILAGKIYEMGKHLYREKPEHLAPIVLAYAEAAPSYQEPVALALFREALPLYRLAYEEKHPIHIVPLISAADEAAVRNEPDLAFKWYKSAQDLLALHRPEGSFLEARQQMGLAYLFRQADQFRTTENWAHRSIKLLKKYKEEGSDFHAAGLYFQFGEVQRALKANMSALHSYEKALLIYVTHDQKERWMARRIGTVYKRLIEINYKLGDYKEACQTVADRLVFQEGGGKIIAYDPFGQFSYGYGKQKIGEIALRFSIGPDCRATGLKILQTQGITKEKAFSAITNLFLTPGRLRPGKHVTAEGELTDIWSIFLQN